MCEIISWFWHSMDNQDILILIILFIIAIYFLIFHRNDDQYKSMNSSAMSFTLYNSNATSSTITTLSTIKNDYHYSLINRMKSEQRQVKFFSFYLFDNKKIYIFFVLFLVSMIRLTCRLRRLVEVYKSLAAIEI